MRWYSWALPLALPGSFFAHLKSQGNREIKGNKTKPYQNQPTNQKSKPNSKTCVNACLAFTVESDVLCFWAVQRKGRNAWLLKMVMGCNWTTHFSISCVLDDLSKLLHCSLSPIWALLALLTAQKQQNSSSVLIISFYLWSRTQRHPITALPYRYFKL